VTIELKPEQEQIIRQQIASGQFKSVDEVLSTALASLPGIRCRDRESGSDAVRRLIEFAEKRFIQLPPGETINDLVHQGHRY
jgi:Arc/MetJ-type ribon-helix-helix transcriptional regulator